MKKTTLVLSALALSIGFAMGPVSSVVAAETAASSSQQLPSLAPMLEKVMPSVVSINVEGSAPVSSAGARGMPPQFQQFLVITRHSVRTVHRSKARQCVKGIWAD